MQRYMTGITDVDREILMRFDDKELFDVCFSKNKYSLKLCDETFFQNRFFQKFPELQNNKPHNLTWQKFYIISGFLKNEYKGSKNIEIIKRFFTDGNKPYFIKGYSNLYIFLHKMRNRSPIEHLLYKTIAPLFDSYNLTSMEIVLKIIVLYKTLDLGKVPEYFLNSFIPISELDVAGLTWVNDKRVQATINKIKEKIDDIYKEKLGNKLLLQEK